MRTDLRIETDNLPPGVRRRIIVPVEAFSRDGALLYSSESVTAAERARAAAAWRAASQWIAEISDPGGRSGRHDRAAPGAPGGAAPSAAEGELNRRRLTG